MHGLESIKYMFKKLNKSDIDWLIMADEDVIFKDLDALYELIDCMRSENYDVCGVRDGGIVSHRNYSPFSINTFFSILNFQNIIKIYDEREINKHQYYIKDEFLDDLDNLSYAFDSSSLYEPYYCFYFWLRRSGKKILFLNSEMVDSENDNISNKVYSPTGSLILLHTWYARSYNINMKHTNRINTYLNDFDMNPNIISPIIFKDFYYRFKVKFNKIFKRIKLKLT